MGFSRRRGRPKKVSLEGKDKGTNELIQKRKFSLTAEPLDLCLQKGLITEEQHNAGIRLRWLYTLRFGAPTISSYLPDNAGGHSCKYEDNGWMERRQNEYNSIIQRLDKVCARKIVMDICVLGHTPSFLHSTPNCLIRQSLSSYKELIALIEGLEVIITLLKCKRI